MYLLFMGPLGVEIGLVGWPSGPPRCVFAHCECTPEAKPLLYGLLLFQLCEREKEGEEGGREGEGIVIWMGGRRGGGTSWKGNGWRGEVKTSSQWGGGRRESKIKSVSLPSIVVGRLFGLGGGTLYLLGWGGGGGGGGGGGES